jgi:hypothetical protein
VAFEVMRTKTRTEVFTPPELINEMLDGFSKSMWSKRKTFIDPACGNGNMLVEVLKQKLAKGHTPLQALSTIYGVDIMADNIEECRMRLILTAGFDEASPDLEEAIKIVRKNIVKHDALTYDYSFKEKIRRKKTILISEQIQAIKIDARKVAVIAKEYKISKGRVRRIKKEF